MKLRFVSIDIETTGLDPENNNILEFGAVAYDLSKYVAGTNFHEVGSFRAVFLHEEITGNPIAMSMNRELIDEIAGVLKTKNFDIISHNQQYDGDSVYVRNSEEFMFYFDAWLSRVDFNNRLTLAGKNLASFDLKFLESNGINIQYRHRMIDPAMLYINWDEDEVLPDLQVCLDRAGISKKVQHTSISDARDVGNLILRKIRDSVSA